MAASVLDPLIGAPIASLLSEDGGATPLRSNVMLDTDVVPTGFTYTGGSNTSTYRDNTGQMRLGATNTARFSYTVDGARLGYMDEEARTNRCTNHNATPAATTNMSVTGDATVSLVADATALGVAKLTNVVTGNVFEASGGAGGGTVVIGDASGTTGHIGATGPATAQLWARDVTGTGASFGITPTPTVKAISGTAYALYEAANMTATATTDRMVITIPAGVTIRFILNQLEAKTFGMSIIKTAGAAATRAADVMRHPDIANLAGFNAAQGTIIASVSPYSESGVDNGANCTPFLAGSSGTFPTSRIYVQTNQTSRKPNAFVQTPSANASVPTGVLVGKKTPVGITYLRGVSLKAFAGPMVYNDLATTTVYSAFTQFLIGCSANSASHFNGYIDRLTIINKHLTLTQIAPYCLGAGVGFTERGISAAGQSNEEGYFSSANTFFNTGEINFNSVLNSVWGTSTRNWVVNGSTSGSSFTAWQGTSVAITRWKNIMSAFMAAGGTIEGIKWNQGETDLGYSTAAYKAGILGIAQEMQAFIGRTGNEVPFVISPMAGICFLILRQQMTT